jgi:hypothetical protein
MMRLRPGYVALLQKLRLIGNVGSFRRTVVTADEQVIEAILQQIETAWNDSVSLAAVFAEDANFI